MTYREMMEELDEAIPSLRGDEGIQRYHGILLLSEENTVHQIQYQLWNQRHRPSIRISDRFVYEERTDYMSEVVFFVGVYVVDVVALGGGVGGGNRYHPIEE